MAGGFVSKAQWVEIPTLAPFVCAWCHVGHSIRSKYLDTGLTYDFEGTVYLCDDCAKTLRKGAGWFTEEEIQDREKHMRELLEEQRSEIKEYKELTELFNTLGLDLATLKKLAKNDEIKKDLLDGFRGNTSVGDSDPAENDRNVKSTPIATDLDSLFTGRLQPFK